MSESSLNWKRACKFAVLNLALVLLAVAPTLAQGGSRVLVAGTTLSDALGPNNPATTFAFDAAANNSASVSIGNAEGGSLAMLLSDINGNTVAQSAGTGSSGSVSLSDVLLGSGGRYHVFVYYEPGSQALDTTFDITLTIADNAAAVGDAAAAVAVPDLVMLVGGINVELTWTGAVDLNLEVRDPAGQNLHWNSRATDNGGVFGFDANGLCEVVSENPTESAIWQPGFLPTGSYEVIVYYEQSCDALTASVGFAVDVSVNGQRIGRIANVLSPVGQAGQNVYVARFEVGGDGAATVSEGGAYPPASLTQLPSGYDRGATVSTPILLDLPIIDEISNAQPFRAYTFSANADDVIAINMQAVGANLDTLLQILDPAGNVVYFNDDAGDGSTNSNILNARLFSSGTHTVVATRYGKDFGGTEGQFQLTLAGSTSGAASQISNLNLPQGDIEVILYWSTSADLQLVVRDPLGESVYDDNPVSASGGILQEIGNANCVAAASGAPVSYVYWPTGTLRPGTYEVDVWYQNTCADFPLPVDFTLLIEVGGQTIVQARQFPQPDQHYVTSFIVQPSGAAVTGLAGFIDAGSGTLAYQEEALDAPLLDSGFPVGGIISAANPFDVYSFVGDAGETVTISMSAATPTLDTNVYLISPSGQEVAANDDGDPFALGSNTRKTDSVISSVILPENGPYLVIATRYGNQYGGSLGVYELALLKN